MRRISPRQKKTEQSQLLGDYGHRTCTRRSILQTSPGAIPRRQLENGVSVFATAFVASLKVDDALMVLVDLTVCSPGSLLLQPCWNCGSPGAPTSCQGSGRAMLAAVLAVSASSAA